MDYWNDSQMRFRAELRAGFMLSKPSAHALRSILADRPLGEVLEELRGSSPDEHALLMEHLPMDADGKPW